MLGARRARRMPYARVVVIIIVLLVQARGAAAQLCHLGPLGDEGESSHHDHGDAPHHVEVTLGAIAATHQAGSYQGVQPSVGWHHGRVGAYAALPAYRVAGDGVDTAAGLGDALVQGHAEVVRGARWRAGVVAAVGLPTGRAEDGLGMGHAMAMPGVWGVVRAGQTTTVLSAIVGKSLGGGGDHAHHMHGVSVNPMNAFELGATARTALAVTRAIDVHAIALVASPIGDGVFRAAGGGGVSLLLRQWTLAGDAHVGLAGDPFGVRTTLSLAHTF